MELLKTVEKVIEKKLSSTLHFITPQALKNKKTTNSWYDFLGQTQVKELLTNIQLISIPCNASVHEALQILTKNKITSACLVDEQNKISGAISVLDLVAFCTSKFATRIAYLPGVTERQVEEFLQMPVKHLQNLSRHENWVELAATESLLALLYLLSQRDIQRVAIVNENGSVEDIVTRFRLLEYVFQNESRFELGLKQAIVDFKHQTKTVQFVYENEMLIAALAKIWNEQISGVAVVSKDGRIVGNISANDLKVIPVSAIGEHALQFPILFQPCSNFLPLTRFGKPIKVNQHDTLLFAIQTVMESKVHRVYVVDDFDAPLSVIGLGDFLEYFLARAVAPLDDGSHDSNNQKSDSTLPTTNQTNQEQK
jgi:CBS domain-containing protein